MLRVVKNNIAVKDLGIPINHMVSVPDKIFEQIGVSYKVLKELTINTLEFGNATEYYSAFEQNDNFSSRVLNESNDLTSCVGTRYSLADRTAALFPLTRATQDGFYWARPQILVNDTTDVFQSGTTIQYRIQNNMYPMEATPTDGVWYAEIICYYGAQELNGVPMCVGDLYFTANPTAYSQLRITYEESIPIKCELLDNPFAKQD